MEVAIVAVILGLGIGYFATENITPVSLKFGSFTLYGAPLYLVVIGALLLGLLLAWVFYLIHSLSSSLSLHGKDSKIKEANQAITDLTKQLHHLELENARMKERLGEQDVDEKSL